MTCPHCGRELICASCGAKVDESARDRAVLLRELTATAEPPPGEPHSAAPAQTFLVVARGHQDLLAELQRVVRDVGWVRVIENRREDRTLLPREGREGSVHLDRD